ncbi:hypothetical protein SAMN06265339_0394 [Desulfurobacterium pacificum]|jgi:hypothetical protein|uniref:4-vinyl reductase 4VR domain-containing protein n=1 Tax=Desulfurobacterium pacificum TaxID=240166 RepID=A0ABY1NCV9_9BACT|nr:hypothetical protein [Desulfurobacterium pacificum]SMP06637.1 hypothetical protein SAMN06265339_0394 [Desulfurobacterium pacificum]
MGFEEKVKSRNLRAENVFIASFIAGLNEFGVLNQAIVDFSAERAGKYLVNYLKAVDSGVEGDCSVEERVEKVLNRLNEELGIGKLSVEGSDGKVKVKILSSSCRFCPKGIGEAELEGTLCPFPKLFESFINSLCDLDFKLEYQGLERCPLVKEGDFCIINYTVSL